MEIICVYQFLSQLNVNLVTCLLCVLKKNILHNLAVMNLIILIRYDLILEHFFTLIIVGTGSPVV